jgi:CRP-like cAMP-binding protein
MSHQFSLDRSVFEDLSLVSGSTERNDFFDDNRLSGQQRLFFQVWASQVLQVGVFGSGHTLTKAGEVPVYGYVITSGEARRLPISEDSEELILGPGSVIGLAEGLAEIPPLYTVEAISSVNCKVIPIDVAVADIQRLNAGMKGICRFTLGRILNGRMEKVPVWLQ